jgi:hypothetical protein
VTLTRLWAFLAVALPVLAALIANLSSVDLTYHLRAGDEILASGALPTVDTWTFTAPGAPWVDQQWGAQVVLSGVYKIAGWTGLAVFRAALVGITFGCLFAIGHRRGLGARRAAGLTLAAFTVAAVALALRPQMLGMAIFAVTLLLVTDRRAHPGRLWLVPVLVVFWANIHGSFFLGPVVLGLAWLEDLHDGVPGARRVLLIALVTAAAACLTPFGPLVWGYAVGLSINPQVTERITEWQPTSLRNVPGILFFASVAAVVVLIARRGDRTSWPTLVWLGVFAAIGTYAIRGVAWWPLAAVAAIAGTLVTQPGPRTVEPRVDPPLIRRMNLVLAGAIIAAGVALLPVWRPVDPGLGTPAGIVGDAPPGITAALRDLAVPGDHVFNQQAWGSWFEFAFPEVLVAIDSRIELFPVEVWDAYQGVLAGVDGWQRQLDDWGVTIAVVDADQGAFSARLEADGWTQAFADDDGAVFVRPGPRSP